MIRIAERSFMHTILYDVLYEERLLDKMGLAQALGWPHMQQRHPKPISRPAPIAKTLDQAL